MAVLLDIFITLTPTLSLREREKITIKFVFSSSTGYDSAQPTPKSSLSVVEGFNLTKKAKLPTLF
jgi:hypothetical protein